MDPMRRDASSQRNEDLLETKRSTALVIPLVERVREEGGGAVRSRPLGAPEQLPTHDVALLLVTVDGSS